MPSTDLNHPPEQSGPEAFNRAELSANLYCTVYCYCPGGKELIIGSKCSYSTVYDPTHLEIEVFQKVKYLSNISKNASLDTLY